MAARTPREAMLAGEPYLADDPELVAMRARAAVLCARYERIWPEDPAAAQEILTDLLGAVGAGTEVRPGVRVDYGAHLYLGERVFVNFGLVALDVAPIHIGDDTQIGPNVQLLAATHPLDPAQRSATVESGRPVTLGRNLWIGGGAIVLPGVSIGDDSVVGAGAVVTRDVEPGVVVVGNPARVVRRL